MPRMKALHWDGERLAVTDRPEPELAEGYVDKVSDVVAVGDTIEVVVINVDDRGKIKLSHRQALEGAEAPA